MSLITQAIPSVLTLSSLLCGFLSAVYALEDNLVTAAWLIIAAALFDALDGKASRLLDAQSQFGVELDSIADVCSFGFAPAVLGYVYVVTYVPQLSAVAAPLAFVFLGCSALRLARFNTQLSGFDKSDFSGLPTPAAAGAIAAFVVFTNSDMMASVQLDWIFPLLQGLIAVLMVSTVRYDTLPRVAWDTKANRVKLLLFGPALLLTVVFPAELLFAFGMTYIGFGLVRAAAHMVRPQRQAVAESSSTDSDEALV